MAKDQALKFVVRVNEDMALQAKLEAVVKEGTEGIVKVAHQAGYDFTAQEFQTLALEQWQANHPSEIAEDELATMAGGAGKIVGPDVPQPHVDEFIWFRNAGNITGN